MSEASLSYASLILADAEQQITSEKLLAISAAAGATVETSWADVFAKALEGKDLKELLFSFAAAGPSAPAAAGAAAATSGSAEEAAEEAAEEEKEESDDDMGFGLFD